MRPITLVFAGCLALAASSGDSSFSNTRATHYSRAMDAYSEEYFRLNREAPHLTNEQMVRRANTAAARVLSDIHNPAALLVSSRVRDELEFTDEEKKNLTKIDQFGKSKIGRTDGPSNEVCDIAKDVDKTKDKFKDKCKDDEDEDKEGCDVDLLFPICPIDEDETPISCVGTEYRSIDGACNNLDKPLLGKANTKYARLIPAVYRDDKEELVGGSPFDFYPLAKKEVETTRSMEVSDRRRRRRGGSTGTTSADLSDCKKDKGFNQDFLDKFKPTKPPTNTFGGCDPVKKKNLPSAREVSATVHIFKPEDGEREADDNKRNNLILKQFGQLLDHDTTLTPESFAEGCCFAETEEDKNESKDNCKSIAIPKGDVFPKKNSNTDKDKTPLCLEVKRSSAFCPGTTKVREQFNAITSWVDASTIYGSSVLDTCKLRTFVDGKLDVFEKKEDDKLVEFLLPKDDEGNFFAGDKRVNEEPGLNAITTLFVREHNRIVEEFLIDIAFDKGLKLEELSDEFKTGMDEVLYQKAKRVVEGSMQNIVYGKGGFLNQVLGDFNYKKFDLDNEVLKDGTKCDKYDPEVDPTILNSFATSAFRFYDTLARDFVPFVDPKDPFITDDDLEDKKDEEDKGGFWLRDGFFNQDIVADNGADKVLVGTANVKAFPFDKFVTTELTNNFLPAKGDDRTDLAAKNIQRGRDHGIAPYNAFRQACDLKPLCDWNEKPDNISPENWAALEKVYNHPSEIELFSGGLSEKPAKPDDDTKPGLLGDTFACLVGRQFQKLKFGDRFFYGFVNKDKPVAGQFTSKQVDALKKRTLSGVLCDNVKDLKAVAKNAFEKEERLQDLVKCDSNDAKDLFKLDLEPFKDDK